MTNEKTFQRILIKGRIANDLNLTFIPSGTAVLNFGIFINEVNNNDFIPVVAWGNKAKYIAEYAEKGDLLLFEAKIRSSQEKSEEYGNRPSLKLQVMNDTEGYKSILQIEKKKKKEPTSDKESKSNE